MEGAEGGVVVLEVVMATVAAVVLPAGPTGGPGGANGGGRAGVRLWVGGGLVVALVVVPRLVSWPHSGL